MSPPEDPRWKQARAGARAGRGFHYQDAAAAFLLVEQWNQEHPDLPHKRPYDRPGFDT